MSNEGDRFDVALTSSEQELRLLVDTIPTLVWTAGPEGDIEYANKRVLEYFGATLDEIISDGWVEKVHPDDVAFKTRTWLANLESRTAHDAVCRFRGADGQYRWFAVSGTPLKAGDGRVLRWYGVLIDIDDRRKAEEALRESEYKLRQIVETVPTLLWSLAPDGELTHFNQRMLDYFGRPFEDFKHGGWGACLHPDDLPGAEKAFFRDIQNGTSHQAEFRLRRADGEFRWHRSRCEPLRDEQGRIIQWYGLTVDIDEAKKAEERLRRSEANLAEAQRLSHTGSWVLNPALSTMLYWSEECYRIWGFDPVQGLPYRAMVLQRIHPDDRDRVYNEAQEALRQKRDYTIEFRIVLPDGTVKYLEAIGHHVISAQGELVEVVGTNVDVTERKCAEQALRTSEAKIRRLVDANIIGIFIWDFDGRILEANEAFLSMVGYDHEDLVAGRIRWTDLTPPEWRDRDARLIQEQMVTGSLQPFEKEYFRKDGSRVPVLIGVATFEEGGNQGVAFVLDLTERKHAEQALRASEAKIRRMVDANVIGVLIWDIDGRIVEANDAFLRLVGYDHEDIVSSHMRWAELTPPEWLVTHVERLAERKTTGILRPYEKEYFRKDGSRVSVLTGGAIFENDGNQGFSFVIDLTERKRAEQALRESEAKFRDYAETASDWFWEIGPDYKFTLLTENAFGSDSADRIGTACWEHALDLETEPEKWRLFQATLDSRKPFRDFVYRSARRNSSPMYVKASGKPVFDTNGEFRGYRGTGTDVTTIMRAQAEQDRLRQLESDLAHMNRLDMMGQQAASLAHEITQPIGAARNYARAALNFLDQQPPNLGEVKKQLGSVVGAADRSGEIIERIRDCIKKAPSRKTRFDLNQAVEEVIALGRGEIARNGVSVRTVLAEGLALVQGDRVQLQQVILNLILNAVDAMGSVEAGTRELLISTEQNQAKGVLVAVRDSGPGIDPENLERVFEAFYTTKTGGMGMGLSICRSIIDAHGGRLWAGVNEPRGAVFQFTLPDAEKEIMDPHPAALQTRARYEGSASDDHHPVAYEDNRRPHRSGRVSDQRRSGRQ